jgi:hypothetical protein
MSELISEVTTKKVNGVDVQFMDQDGIYRDMRRVWLGEIGLVAETDARTGEVTLFRIDHDVDDCPEELCECGEMRELVVEQLSMANLVEMIERSPIMGAQ